MKNQISEVVKHEGLRGLNAWLAAYSAYLCSTRPSPSADMSILMVEGPISCLHIISCFTFSKHFTRWGCEPERWIDSMSKILECSGNSTAEHRGVPLPVQTQGFCCRLGSQAAHRCWGSKTWGKSSFSFQGSPVQKNQEKCSSENILIHGKDRNRMCTYLHKSYNSNGVGNMLVSVKSMPRPNESYT